MDGVEGMMRNMRLSEAEKKGIQIGGRHLGKGKVEEAQAIGKLLSEKLVSADVVEAALARVWCPIRGMDVKALGENHFLFTFHQPSGKTKALEEGPWMVSRDLMVVAEFDESKTLEEIEFNSIPIWVRILKLPLGMMLDREAAMILGQEIGSFMDVDLEDNHSDAGCFLRVKVRLNITRPLMRGVTVSNGGKDRWCPLVYEFLPDFCYVCGIIGHTDKLCALKVPSGEAPQFDKKLRYIPQKKRGDRALSGRGSDGRGLWRPSFRAEGGGRWGSGGSGSDGPSWGKSSHSSEGRRKDGEEDEVTSPIKTIGGVKGTGGVQKALNWEEKGEKASVVMADGEKKGETVPEKETQVLVPLGDNTRTNDTNSDMPDMHVDQTGELKQGEKEKESGTGGKGEKKGHFKRLPRAYATAVSGQEALGQGDRKRSLERQERGSGKKVKFGEDEVADDLKAGLTDQPCKHK